MDEGEGEEEDWLTATIIGCTSSSSSSSSTRNSGGWKALHHLFVGKRGGGGISWKNISDMDRIRNTSQNNERVELFHRETRDREKDKDRETRRG